MSAAKSAKPTAPDLREQAVDTLFRLLETRDFKDITLPEVAREAGMSLGDLRLAVSSRMDILEAFAARIDRKVLDDLDEDMGDQPPRDRLFDVLMSRLDMLGSYRKGLKSLRSSVRRDPALALALNGIALRSQGWMLSAAGISIPGFKGALVLQGLAISFARVVDVFLDEDDPGLPRTMAALDRALDKGEVWMDRLDGAERAARPLMKGLCRLAERRSRRRARRQEDAADDLSENGSGAAAPGA
ncbi:TetR/AcrR family transcriptional regulator [Microvirga tunisiensis]|uniref:TetR/AcrR family transcriptional regulator n=1 Tax=Pannonibacter tanglangensis TaxID=2750084 RepID=A0A7X5EZC1_9HYPH|nr:TetR/AcrR family transcriptional regulator [Pannonibacter sp. XCT-53]NBN76913.1 TetR/AcrR family transcriptional regulator [Pannonibacter sp. XCT-53]